MASLDFLSQGGGGYQQPQQQYQAPRPSGSLGGGQQAQPSGYPNAQGFSQARYGGPWPQQGGGAGGNMWNELGGGGYPPQMRSGGGWMDRFAGQNRGYGPPQQAQGNGYPFARRSYLATSPQFNQPVGTQPATDPRIAPTLPQADNQQPPAQAAPTGQSEQERLRNFGVDEEKKKNAATEDSYNPSGPQTW